MSRIFSINKRRKLLGVGFGTTVIDLWKLETTKIGSGLGNERLERICSCMYMHVRANILFKWVWTKTNQSKPRPTYTLTTYGVPSEPNRLNSWRQIRIEILVQPFVQSQSGQTDKVTWHSKKKLFIYSLVLLKRDITVHTLLSTFKHALNDTLLVKTTALIPNSYHYLIDLLEPLILIKKHPFLVDKLTIFFARHQ